jgi:hypothetical protein
MIYNQQGIDCDYSDENLPDITKVFVDTKDDDTKSGDGVLDNEEIPYADIQRVSHKEVQLFGAFAQVIQGKSRIKNRKSKDDEYGYKIPQTEEVDIDFLRIAVAPYNSPLSFQEIFKPEP